MGIKGNTRYAGLRSSDDSEDSTIDPRKVLIRRIFEKTAGQSMQGYFTFHESKDGQLFIKWHRAEEAMD
jgi:hypothetical protein